VREIIEAMATGSAARAKPMINVALRRPGSAARIARGLWAIWAVLVWNVVFDHVIVVAGRNYVYAAARAANVTGSTGPSYLVMDEWMRPAVRRALWTATAAAGSILAIGLFAVRLAGPLSQPGGAGAPGVGAVIGEAPPQPGR
jgi:hypothetical protein